jgi:antitoxin component YwqK of YwqJK toxin-antitoxin module
MTIIYHPEGTIWMKGNYINGLKQGPWTVFKPDGSKEADEFYKNSELVTPPKTAGKH